MATATTFHGSNETFKDYFVGMKAEAEGLSLVSIKPEVVTIKKEGSPYQGEKRCLLRAKFVDPESGEIFEETFWPRKRCTAAEEKEWESRKVKDFTVRYGFWQQENEAGEMVWVAGEPKWLSTSVDGKSFEEPKGEVIEFKEAA